MDIATALRAMLNTPGIDDTCQIHGDTFRDIANAALAAHDAGVSAGGWRVRDGMPAVIEDANGAIVARPLARFDMSADEYRANAARIVACVNACEGIADPSRLVPLLRQAREGAAYLDSGELVLQLDGAAWMAEAHNAITKTA